MSTTNQQPEQKLNHVHGEVTILLIRKSPPRPRLSVGCRAPLRSGLMSSEKTGTSSMSFMNWQELPTYKFQRVTD